MVNGLNVPANNAPRVLSICSGYFCVIFYDKIVNNKILALHCVFPYIEFEQGGHMVLLAERNAVEAYVGADKPGEFVGRNLRQGL